MAPTEANRDEELRQLLTDAIEVQLAAFKAGIGFWREWVEQTSEFVKSASNSLRTINSAEHEPKEVLLEVFDAGRAGIRSMTELPRHTASRFIEELDEIKKKKKKTDTAGSARTRSTAKRNTKTSRTTKRAAARKKSKSRRKRAGRVKA
jgi:hypothetical protein